MLDRALKMYLTAVAICLLAASAAARALPQAPSGAKYQVVKACSLLPLAEVKKLAPWPKQMDAFAKAEEEPLGSYGSSCNYPTLDLQVMSFARSTIDSLRKQGALETVSGVGDEAYLRHNKNGYAELYAKVGPHLLTVQYNLGPNQTYDASKPTVIALGKAFAAKLR
jgi:hypothetical protein